MRCDLHVHTTASGMCNIPLLDRVCRESYNDPEALYQLLKQRGMDLVTVTDHDSIDAVERLRRHPDFFLSEEVTCHTPSGTELHMGVYGIAEADHTQLQLRRNDLPALISYLTQRKLFFSINHVFSSLTGPRTDSDFAFFEEFFPGMEVLNGQMLEASNRAAASLARRWQKAPVAGSDAHTLHSLGLTFTEISDVQTAREFLAGLSAGRGVAHGVSGDFGKLTLAVMEIGWSMMREKNWTALMAPLFLAVPAVILANTIREYAFESKWSRRLRAGFAGQSVETPVLEAA
jgi:predicted metal-dependent phosphoesterase TrpH